MTVALTLPVTLFVCVVVLSTKPVLSHSQTDDNDQYDTRCDLDACDSLVNKCKLTNRCPCDSPQDLNCVKECINCLEEKFGKCCSCVHLCPPVDTDTYASHVGDIAEADEQFFNAMTEFDDIHGRWTRETYVDRLQRLHPESGLAELTYKAAENKTVLISDDPSLDSMNCTIAFINRHLSMTKCKKSCLTLGASHFRWFHDGCCECVGKYCFNYGKDEAKCEINDIS